MLLQCVLIDMTRTTAITAQDKHARNGAQHFVQLVTVRYAEHGMDTRLQGDGLRRAFDLKRAKRMLVKVDELHGMPSVTGHRF